MPTVYFHTFGCRVNQYESESMREKLLAAGYRSSADWNGADVCVINSCTVTAEADRKCRQFVRRVLKKNPEGRVIVTGCYATRDPHSVKSLSPRVEVFGNHEKDVLPSAVTGCSLTVEHSPLLTVFSGHTRAFVKVQDGCDAACTYCIIPSVRPVMNSRPIEDISNEVTGLVSAGYKEIVLTGIRLGSYGLTSSGGRVGRVRGNLADLLRRLSALPGTFRIRLSSLEITEVTEELMEVVCASDKICPNFHLPLQSGDDAVLKRMGRWYNAQFYADTVAMVRRFKPEVGITADVITGFPGETNEQFENGFRFMETWLNGLHVFPFSDRPGTPAVKLSDHVDPVVQKARAERLVALDHRLRAAFQNRFAGQKRLSLVELDGAFTDNGIRLPAPLPFPRGTLAPIAVSPAQI